MPNPQDYRRRREALWHEDPRCFYCKEVTILGVRGSRLNPLAATIEHLRSRYRPERQEPPRQNEPRYVLSCWGCNQAANHVEQVAVPLEEKQKRSRAPRHADDETSRYGITYGELRRLVAEAEQHHGLSRTKATRLVHERLTQAMATGSGNPLTPEEQRLLEEIFPRSTPASRS